MIKKLISLFSRDNGNCDRLHSDLISLFIKPTANKKDRVDLFNRSISSVKNQRSICAYQFKTQEPAYRCLDCQTDQTCIQCIPCFKKSKHTGHRVSMTTTAAGGCCDCGDAESWSISGFCSDHRGESQLDSLSKDFDLDEEEVQSAKEVIDWVVNLLTDAFAGTQNVFLFLEKIVSPTEICASSFVSFRGGEDLSFSLKEQPLRQSLHRRFFSFDRLDAREKNDECSLRSTASGSSEFILFVHNTEACDWSRASSVVCSVMKWPSGSHEHLLHRIDHAEFSAIALGEISPLKSLADKFESNGMKCTILKAPSFYFILSRKVFTSLLDWILMLSKGSPVFRKIIAAALRKPLTLHQQLKTSPMTLNERKAFVSSQFATQLRFTPPKFRPKYDALVQGVAKFKGKFNFSTELEKLLLSLNAKKVEGFFMMAIDNYSKRIYVQIGKDCLLWCGHPPISYESLVYDTSDEIYQKTIYSVQKAGHERSRLDTWIECQYMLFGDLSLQRKYNDITFNLMIDSGFKEYWGHRLMSLYPKLTSLHNFSLKTKDFSVLSISVQILSIPRVNLNLLSEGQIVENFYKAAKLIIDQDGDVFTAIMDHNFYKFNNIFNDLLVCFYQKEVVQLLLSLKGMDSFLVYVDFLSLFDEMKTVQRKFGEHVHYPDRRWHYCFHLESRLWTISSSLFESLGELIVKRQLKVNREVLNVIVQKMIKKVLSKFTKSPHRGPHRDNDDCAPSHWPCGPFRTDIHLMSFHYPSVRFVNTFLGILLRHHLIDFPSLAQSLEAASLSIPCSTCLEPNCSFLFEHSLRTLSMVGQINSNLWALNGISLLSQGVYYRIDCAKNMLNADLFSLQIGICAQKAKRFFRTFFRRFLICGWFDQENERSLDAVYKEWDREKFLAIVDDAIKLICRLYSFREFVGSFSKEDELCYKLSNWLIQKPLSFSKLMARLKRFGREYSEDEVEKALQRISTGGVRETENSKYELKTEFWAYFDPFFQPYELTKNAETNYKRKFHCSEIYFDVSSKLLPAFSEINQIYANNSIFKLVNHVLDFEDCKLATSHSFLTRSCLLFVYMGVRDIEKNVFPARDKEKFFKKLLKRFDMTKKSTFWGVLSQAKRSKNNYFPIPSESVPTPPQIDRTHIRFSIIESICRINRLTPSDMAKWILYHCSKLNTEVENIVLEYFNDLEALNVQKQSFKVQRSEGDLERIKKIKRIAVDSLRTQAEQFFYTNKIDFEKPSSAHSASESCIICRSDVEDSSLYMLTHTFETNVLLTNSFPSSHRREILDSPFERNRSYLNDLSNANYCTHLMHPSCFLNSFRSRSSEMEQYHFTCPFCLAIVNSITELRPISARAPCDFRKLEDAAEWTRDNGLAVLAECIYGQTEQPASVYYSTFLSRFDVFGVFVLRNALYQSLGENSRIKQFGRDLPFLKQVLANSSLFCAAKRNVYASSSFVSRDPFGGIFERVVNCWGCLYSVFSEQKEASERPAEKVWDLDEEFIELVRKTTEPVECRRGRVSARVPAGSSNLVNSEERVQKNVNRAFGVLLGDFLRVDVQCKKNFAARLLRSDPFEILVDCLLSCFEAHPPFANEKLSREKGIVKFGEKMQYALHLCWVVHTLQIILNLSFYNKGCGPAEGLPTFIPLSNKHRLPAEFIDLVDSQLEKPLLACGRCSDCDLDCSKFCSEAFIDLDNAKMAAVPFLRKVALLLCVAGLLKEEVILADPKDIQQTLCLPNLEEVISSPKGLSLLKKWLPLTPKNKPENLFTVIYKSPKLIELPLDFSDLFEMSRDTKCRRCRTAPENPGICLQCSDIVCRGFSCCKTGDASELKTHADGKCGRGSGLFLFPKTNELLLVCKDGAVHFPSPYVNCYGEEDRYLILGKPLKLRQERMDRLNVMVLAGKIPFEVLKILRFDLKERRNEVELYM